METSSGPTLKQPSAFVPVAMSLAALTMLLTLLVIGLMGGRPLVREPDEGVAAHIFQILMAGQMPVVAFFAIKWLPRAPGAALKILALQAGAGLAAMAPVYFLGL